LKGCIFVVSPPPARKPHEIVTVNKGSATKYSTVGALVKYRRRIDWHDLSASVNGKHDFIIRISKKALSIE
jgi:hypothetical protein